MSPFAHSLQHVLAELTRLDLLLRVQVWRIRQAQTDGADLQAFYITEAEIDALIERTIATPIWASVALPAEQVAELQATLDAMDKQITQQVAASQAAGVSLRLNALVQQFGLSAFDRDAILVCLAPELDLRYTRLYAYLHNDVTRTYASVDLLLNLLCPHLETRLAMRSRLHAAAPLRRYNMLHLSDDPGQRQTPWLARSLRLDERIMRFLLDDDNLDERLLPYARLVHPTAVLSDLQLPAGFLARLETLVKQHAHLLLYFKGVVGVGKQTSAEALCHNAALPLLVVQGERLAALSRAEFDPLARLAEREARLQGAALYWQGFDLLLAEDKVLHLETLLELLTQRPGLTFLAGNIVWEPPDLDLNAPFIRVPFPRPDYAERRQLWHVALGGDEPEDGMDAVADAFAFSGGEIYAAAATARNLAHWRDPAHSQVTTADLYAASRLQSNRKLASLARQVEASHTWNDLVLPSERMAQLREMVDQMKLRARVYGEWGFEHKLALGKGINALFCGPPGTGKTMAAGIMAGELGLDLYKIDLATVVSKYIGETEKNLARIFAEAETSNAILFFDEADALFGKRSEVKDSHDRYANIEISYLLQKMEEYTGITILASNLRKNLDEAFVRRMRFIVDFPFPDTADRRRIWQSIWPATTPRDPDLDLDFIAERMTVAGGNIRNIALAAAFLAAADGQVVTMDHLIHASEREYQKMGKLLSADEFGPYRRVMQ